jgi:hypothetical protein
MKKHKSTGRAAGKAASKKIYPIQIGIRAARGRVAIPREQGQGIISQLSKLGGHLESRAVLEGGEVRYKKDGLRGLDCVTSQLVIGFGEGLRASALFKQPKGIAALSKQRSGPPANIRESIPPFSGKAVAAGLSSLGERGVRHYPRLTPGQCENILSTVNQYATTAQSAYTTAQADFQAADDDMNESYGLDPTGTLVINNLGTWTQLQTLAAAGIASLNDIQTQATVAAQAAASALLYENVACGNIAQIQAAIEQASNAANEVSNLQNSLGTILLMGYFLGNQSIPKPTPPPGSGITPGCLTATPLTALGITYGVRVSFSEACTQSLLSTMVNYCGTPSLGSYLTEIGAVVTGVAAAVATSATVVGAVGGVIGAAFAALKAECQLMQQIIPEADNHGRGISMNFSAIPILGAAFFAGELGIFAAVEEATLIAETQISGGTGDGIIDGFWITGN